MSKVDFKKQFIHFYKMNQKDKNITFFCVDNQKAQTRGANYFYYNLAEYWVQEFKHHGLSSEATSSWDEAFHKAIESGADWAFFYRPGNQFFNQSEFLSTVKKYLNPETLCLGHILNRSDEYLELHPQCFIINMKIYKSLGYPKYDDFSRDITLQKFHRSEDNFHDAYTPKSIERANGETLFKKATFGSKIISEGLKAGFKVEPFPEEVRNSKFFLYDKSDFLENFSALKKICDLASGGFYCANTEVYFKNEGLTKPIETLVIPPSGLFPFKLLKDISYIKPDPNHPRRANLMFYDISQNALNIYRELFTSWDGRDYPSFIATRKNKYAIKQASRASEVWEDLLNDFGGQASWVSWFEELKENCNVQFKDANVLSRDIYNRFFFIPPQRGENIFWLSNIFHYLPTHLYFSHKQLIDQLNKIFLYFKKNNPDWWIKYNITAKGPGNIGVFFDKAENIQLVEPAKFPWEEQ